MADVDLADRRVLIREDFNVPIADGEVTSDARIRAALPTLKSALDRRARVLVMSHLGRPKEGERDPALSLAPVAKALSTSSREARPLRRGLDRRRRGRAGRNRAARERAFPQGREEGRRGARETDGRALRRVRHGCVRHRAPRGGEHARCRAPGARRLRGAAARRRARCPRARAARAGAAARRGRRRLESLDEAVGAREPDRQGRSAGGRRWHREYVSRGHRHAGRQVPP